MTIVVPDSVFIGDVLYSPGATLGPRVQVNIQLVFFVVG